MAASARAMMQPMEWATRWKEEEELIIVIRRRLFCFCCGSSSSNSRRLVSIASTWSLSVYMQLPGLGLCPKPRRSTANNPLLPRMEDSRNTVSAQKEDDDAKPCKKMAV